MQWNNGDTSSEYPVVQYRVEYGNESVLVDRTNGSTQQVILENLRSNTLYDIRVRSLTTNPIIQSDKSQGIQGITGKFLMLLHANCNKIYPSICELRKK